MTKTQPEKFPEQTEYEESLKTIKEAAIKVRLRQQYGINPYKISRKKFDDLRRLFDSIDKADQEVNNKINALRMESQKELQKTYEELNKLAGVIRSEQNPSPPLPHSPLSVPSVSVVESKPPENATAEESPIEADKEPDNPPESPASEEGTK